MLKGVVIAMWWQHFKLSNFVLNIILLILVVNILFLQICKSTSIFQNFAKLDYFFALTNLNTFLPLLFFVNTFFTLLFILELAAILIFYKFVVSKV